MKVDDIPTVWAMTYFISIDGESGALHRKGHAEKLLSAEIDRTTLVWRKGMEDMTLERVEDLHVFALFRPL